MSAQIKYYRQLDLLRKTIPPVTIVGTGGIGSPVALVIAKMGAERMLVYDFDTVEEHNYPNQMLPEKLEGKTTIGMPKTEALRGLLYGMTGVVIETAERYVDQPLSGIVIVATDSMESRKLVFEKIKFNPEVELFIDARMSALAFEIYAVNPYNTEIWERAYFDDSEASPLPCTAKSIIFNTFGIAAEIGNIICKFVNGDKYPKMIKKDFTTFKYSIGGLDE